MWTSRWRAADPPPSPRAAGASDAGPQRYVADRHRLGVDTVLGQVQAGDVGVRIVADIHIGAMLLQVPEDAFPSPGDREQLPVQLR